jgi:hypothetical protein
MVQIYANITTYHRVSQGHFPELHDAELPDVSLGEFLVPYLPGGRIFFSDQDLATKAQRHKEESQRAKSALSLLQTRGS